MSVEANITEEARFFTGEDKSLVFTVRDGNGRLMNITGWSLEWKLATALAGEPILILTGSITDGPIGRCKVIVPAGDTTDLLPGTYFYDLRRVDLGSYAELAYGTLELLDPYVDEDPWKVL